MSALRALLVAAALVSLGAGAAPDLVDLALAWARGDYRSPLLCQFGDEPRRGLRRVLIAAGPRHAPRRTDRIRFFDLEADGASRCFSELGEEQANLVGTLHVTLAENSPHDTARRDFKSALRREHGFRFRVERGALRVARVGAEDAARLVDFTGGSASLTAIEPGSDAARLLAEFDVRRKLRLALEAPDATRLVVDLLEVAPR